jgi:hypothetical protein
MGRDWIWKKLEERERKPQWRGLSRPDYVLNRQGELVRYQTPRAIIEAAERFAQMTKEIDAGQDLPCVIFTGGETFRVDQETVTTPRRFIYEYLTGEILPDDVRLRTLCKTPKCCRVSHIISFTWQKPHYRTRSIGRDL